MKLSMMSCVMGFWPKDFDLQATLELTRRLELDGIDFITLHGHDPKELRKAVDDCGIPVVCHAFDPDLNFPDPAGRAEGLDAARRGIDAAVILGAPAVMIMTPPKPGVDRDTSRHNWIAGLREVQPIAADAGIVLTVENFGGVESPFVLAEDLLEAVREVPGLKITYDNGNAAGGEDPAQSFTRCAEHVVHAHFKDWLISDEAAEGSIQMLDRRFYTPAVIGEGAIDQRHCLQAMKAAGYQGYINIEYEGKDDTPEEAITRAVAYLRETWAGLDG